VAKWNPVRRNMRRRIVGAMIVLLGLPADAPLAMVGAELERLGQTVVFVDQREVLQIEVDVTFGRDVSGTLRIGGEVVDLDSVSAVYLRLYGLDQLPVLRGHDRNGAAWMHAVAVNDTISTWTELTAAFVVNRLSAMASNGSKPYQSRIIEAHGFKIPDTLVTTDAEAVREFWLRYGAVIYKSTSGVRSIVNRLTAENAGRLSQLHWCPTQFQQYIPGHDYRVHVVGEQTFACEIVSDADDYRYAGRKGLHTKLQAWPIPPQLAERCRSLARTLELPFAGIDLRYHPAGQWFCFEVNPSPAFSYYEDATGQPIAAAVARLLIDGAEAQPK
jgi:glutathione synthase/RimK-type ligase-like ATP-grasp enzyme